MLASRLSTFLHSSSVLTHKNTSTSLSPRHTVEAVPAVSSASVLWLLPRRRRVETRRRKIKYLDLCHSSPCYVDSSHSYVYGCMCKSMCFFLMPAPIARCCISSYSEEQASSFSHRSLRGLTLNRQRSLGFHHCPSVLSRSLWCLLSLAIIDLQV